MARMRLGDMLVKAGLIDEVQLQSALGQQKQWGGKLGDILVNMGILDEMMLWRGLSRQLDVPLVSLAEIPLRPDLLRTIPVDMAERLEIVPISLDDRTLTIATSDPNNIGALDEVAFRTGLKVRTVLAPAREVEWAIRSSYRGERSPCPPPRMRRQIGMPDSALPQNMPQLEMQQPQLQQAPMSSWPPFERPSMPPQNASMPPQGAQPPFSRAATPIQQIRNATPNPSVPPGWAPAPPTGYPQGMSAEEQLRQANDMLRALVEMCIERGVFTREELWDRLTRR